MGSAGYNAGVFAAATYNVGSIDADEKLTRVKCQVAINWDIKTPYLLAASWNCRQALQLSRQLMWHDTGHDAPSVPRALKVFGIAFDVRHGVFANIKRGDEHFKRSGYNTSHASLYGDALYNGRHQVRGNGGTIFCWHVWKNVSTQRQITWDALRSAKAKQFLRWDVHGIGVDCQRQIAWDLRQGVYAKRKIAWRIHLKDFHVIWRIHPTYHYTTRINHRDHKEASCPFLNKT